MPQELQMLGVVKTNKGAEGVIRELDDTMIEDISKRLLLNHTALTHARSSAAHRTPSTINQSHSAHRRSSSPR